MEVQEVIYPEVDCFKLARIVSMDIPKTRILKFLISTLAIILSSAVIVQTYFFLTRGDLQYFVQYSPSYFQAYLAITACCEALFGVPIFYETFTKTMLWDWRRMSKEMLEELHKMQFQMKCLVIFILLGCFLMAVFVVIPEDKNSDFTLKLIDEFFIFNRFFSILMRGYFLVVIFIIPLAYLHIYCVSNHAKVQVCLMIDYIRNNCEKKEECNEIFQKKIKTMLINSIRHSGRLIFHGRKSIRQLKFFIFFYPVFLGIIAISSTAFILKGEGTIMEHYLKPIILISIVGLGGLLVTYAGQDFEDTYAKAQLVFSEQNWYDWNRENQKLYLIFLINITLPFQIKFTENIAINYNLALTVLRAIYSAVSIFIRIKV